MVSHAKGASGALITGVLLVVTAARKRTFERVFGATLKAQFSLERRVIPWRRRSYDKLVNRVRLGLLAFGILSVGIGALGLISWLL